VKNCKELIIVTILASGLTLFATQVSASNKATKNSLSFAVAPQQSIEKLESRWTPILRYLEKISGISLHLKIAADIKEFEKHLANGKYDIAYMNPYHYTVFHNKPGYFAFAKQKDKKITGIIVVRKDSPYRNVSELHNQTLAFPFPTAFGASVLPRKFFEKNNLDIKSMYVSSHKSVYRSVLKGDTPAGGGILGTLYELNPNIHSKLRILWKTKKYSPHAIAAHPRVNKKVLMQLKSIMFSMNEEKEGKNLLSKIKFSGIESATDKDWSDIRELRIKK
jgi:phosphonate transport system substrate-binding protein